MPRARRRPRRAHAGRGRAQGPQGPHGRKKRAKGDIPRIQLNTLRNRSEATSGSNARLAERRRAQAIDDAASARERIEVLQPLTVAVPSTGLPGGKTVLGIDAASVGLTIGR